MAFMQFVLIYFLCGFVSASIMFILFPPAPGYRPSLFIQIAAATTFTVLWPILWLLSICFFIGVAYRFWTGESRSAPSRIRLFGGPSYEDVG